MPENLKKVFYALDDPLSCLFYARDIIRSVGNTQVNVLLPKHIDPSRFEFLLLKDAEYFNGITVQGISSFPRRVLASKGYFNLPQRVDQIELSEHFHGRMPRSLARPLLNAVLELKHAYFVQDYIKELLGKRREKEGAILLEVFDEYQAFLERKGCNDDADHKKFFMDKALTPGSALIPEDSIFIFAGFHEFSSFDLDVIKAVSSRAAGTFIASPNIIDTELEYSKLLDEQFISMGFKMVRVKNERSQDTKVHEFGSINDEAYYVSKVLKTGTVYAVTDVDNYYSLMRYHLGGDAVSINAAMRLDRSCYLTVLSTVLLLNNRGWIHHDVVKLLHFIPFWKDEQGVLKLISGASNELTLPRGYDTWQRLVDECGNSEVKEFFKTIKEKIPPRATPLDLEKILKVFFSSDDDLEMQSVMNLVARLVTCLGPKEITVESFVRKLYNHAEENYVLKGPLKFKSLNVTLAGLAAGNIAEDVWFVGMNQDAFSSIAGEDVVMNDDLILTFRSEGFLRPTSRESAAIASKIIKDASRSRMVSYVSGIGAVADIYKDIEPVKHQGQITAVLNGAISELEQKELILKEHKFPRYSASLFKGYIECPYVCFATKVLKAQKKEAMDLSLQPKDAGNLLHKALELLLPRSLKNEKFDIEAELGNILTTEFEQLGSHPLRKVFIKYYASIVENALNEEVAYMHENNLVIFDRPESEFKLPLDFSDGVPVKGKIDRLDVNKADKKLCVVDYKSSEIPSGKDIETGDDIQLAVYIMAMAAKYPDFNDYNGCYVSIKGLRRSPLDIFSLEKAKHLFSIRGSKAVEGIRNGVYTPRPMDTGICEKCDYRRCCGAV